MRHEAMSVTDAAAPRAAQPLRGRRPESVLGPARKRSIALPSRRAGILAGVAAIVALGSAALFRHAYVTPDMVAALIWGRELAHWDLSSFAQGPTPHPLTILAGAATSVLGAEGSYDATFLLFGPVALGGLISGVVAVAWRVASPAAGVLAAGVLLTSPVLIGRAAAAGYDIAFAALVLHALALELARPRRGVAPLLLLAAAGLIRPEAWVLAGIYWLWVVPALQPRMRLAAAALVAVGPVVWVAMDYVVTGDPLWSLHITSSYSERLYGQHTRLDNLGQGGADLFRWVGAFTLLLALPAVFGRSRVRSPGMTMLRWLLALTVGIFLLLVTLAMASNLRYLLVPACLIGVLAAVTATRWRAAPRALVVALIVLALLETLVRGSASISRVQDLRPATQRLAQTQALASRPDVRRMLATCPSVALPGAIAAEWVYFSGRPISRWHLDERARYKPDLYVAPASVRVAEQVLVRRRFDSDATFVVPPGLRPGPRSRDWLVHVRPGSPCVVQATGGR